LGLFFAIKYLLILFREFYIISLLGVQETVIPIRPVVAKPVEVPVVEIVEPAAEIVEPEKRYYPRKFGKKFVPREKFLNDPAFIAMRAPRAGTELAENRRLAATLSPKFLIDDEPIYPQLSKKQQRWVDFYLNDPKKDIEKAARLAGYTESFCVTQAKRQFKKQLTNIVVKMEEERVWTKLQISHERVVQEMANIAFSNLDNFLIDDPENPGKKVVDFSKATSQDIAALGSYTEEETKKGKRVKITMHDKLAALQMLGKSMGMFKERVEVDTVDGKPVLTITSIDSILFGGATLREVSAKLEPRGFIDGGKAEVR
jgi:phage terminase small subunit